MADGDIVHNRLKPFYQKPYKWLCEGKASLSECTEIAIKALKEDLSKKGEFLVLLSQHVAEKLTQSLISVSGNGSTDWAALNIEIYQLIRPVKASHYLKELFIRACKSFCQDIRYGRELNVENASEKILKRFISEVYESEFKERVLLLPKHHAEINEETLDKRINAIQTDIEQIIYLWAKKAIKSGTLDNIPLFKNQNENNIKVLLNDDDLLSEFNHNNQKKLNQRSQEEGINSIKTHQDWINFLSSNL